MNDEIARRRLRKKIDDCEDNSKVNPADLLRAMADDIESGELKVDGLLLMWVDRATPSGGWETGAYRYNLTRDQELVLVELAKVSVLKRWLN